MAAVLLPELVLRLVPGYAGVENPVTLAVKLAAVRAAVCC
jgi:hypothetical protein